MDDRMIDGRFTPANLTKLLGDKPTFASGATDSPSAIAAMPVAFTRLSDEEVQALAAELSIKTDSGLEEHDELLWIAMSALRGIDGINPDDVALKIEQYFGVADEPGLSEEALQKIAADLGAKCHVWDGVGARDIEEVLKMAREADHVAASSDTSAMVGQIHDLLEAVDDALDTIPCDCGIRRREDGDHMSGCYLFHLNVERMKLEKGGR